MNTKIIKNIVVVMVIFISSCQKDYLDIVPKDRIVSTAVWGDANLIELYVNKLYRGLPNGFERHMWAKYCDEAYGDGNFLAGRLTPDNISNYGKDSGYINYYNEAYKNIREANIFFEEIVNANMPDERKAELAAEVHFIKAFVYANLIWRYGGVPIVEEIYGLQDDIKISRNSYQEVVDYIISELDAALPDLADKYESGDNNFGRATKHAVMALKSRVYLYAASNLENPTGDLSKWQLAADAAKDLIDTDSYELYPDYGEEFLDTNNEQIFVRTFSVSSGHQVTFLQTNHTLGGWGGWGGSNCPSQNLVDDYEMTNGIPPFINDSIVNPISGYDPQNPYANRDPRFYDTVIYQGDVFRADARPSDKPEYDASNGTDGTIDPNNGRLTVTAPYGIDHKRINGDNSLTSYNMKKFIDKTRLISRSNGGYTQPWIFFRLAEVYLNYAEAMYELGDEDEARKYVNLVRRRPSVNMPDLTNAITGDDLRDRIRNERRIELAYEGHRFFDVRRWKIAPQVESIDIKGMTIYKMEDGSLFFNPSRIITRPEWDPKYYYMPIPRSEINKDTGLDQSPLWN